MSWTYQVGDLFRFTSADPEFDDIKVAMEHARKQSAVDDRLTYGVWTGQKQGSLLLAIAYQGDVFDKSRVAG